MALTFSEQAEEEFQKILSRYPNKQAPLLMVLHLAQEEFGHVGLDVQQYVATRLDLPPAFVYGVVTFYTMYHQQPVGKYHIEVCTNLSCQLRNADALVSCLENRLKVRFGQTTEDKRFTVSEVECLAACGNAPVIQLNGAYKEDLTVEKLEKILDGLK